MYWRRAGGRGVRCMQPSNGSSRAFPEGLRARRHFSQDPLSLLSRPRSRHRRPGIAACTSQSMSPASISLAKAAQVVPYEWPPVVRYPPLPLPITAVGARCPEPPSATQRHTVDRHHLEADLRSSTDQTGLQEPVGRSSKLGEAASSGGTRISCCSRRAICGMSVHCRDPLDQTRRYCVVILPRSRCAATDAAIPHLCASS